VLHGYADSDGDGWGDPCDCEPASGYAFPGAPEYCDGADTDCDGAMLSEEADADADGYAVCQNDCDDGDVTRHPGATEICNKLDDDCDSILPVDERDTDYDGFAPCEGDCDDGAPWVYPGAVELCRNTDDDNCDGLIDHQDTSCLSPVCVVASTDPGYLELRFAPVDACPPGFLGMNIDIVWGDLANVTPFLGGIDLGPVTPVACNSGFRSHQFDSLRPDPGHVDFILARDASAMTDHYGRGSSGLFRYAGPGDCP
jgi:hypothetical protein